MPSNADKTSDVEQMLRAVSRGDVSALETLYNAFRSSVFCYALSILSDRSSAEDILQDTFVRVFSSARQHAPGRDGRAWIFAITRNLCLDLLKSKAHAVRPLEDSAEETPDLASVGFIRSMELRDALARLTPEFRSVVVMHLAAGFRFREIAALEGVPLSRIHRLYAAALKQLSCYYQPKPPKGVELDEA